MRLILSLAAIASTLSFSPDSLCVNIEDATPYIRPEFRPMARMLTLSPEFTPTCGNTFQLITQGNVYGDMLFQDLRDARELIELELFLFCDDSDGNRVRDLLFQKADEGVEVRYTHDAFGNMFDSIFDGRPIFRGYYAEMSRRGIKKAEYAPLWGLDPTYVTPGVRNHRKINIIDRKIAYTGGMNISEGSISGWGDAMLRIQGPAVDCLRAIFLRNWNSSVCAKDKVKKKISVSPSGPPEGKIMQAVADGADVPSHTTEDIIVWVLDNARDYVWFQTPYFLPNRPVLKAFKRAADRGVDVRVLIPIESDLPALDPAYHTSFKTCTQSGVKLIYLKPPFNHSKTFVCDDYLVFVGSSNIDKLSLKRAYEVNTLIYDEQTARQQKSRLEEAQEGSTLIGQDLFDTWTGSEYFKQALFSLISPWL